jgi:hypothetical protein
LWLVFRAGDVLDAGLELWDTGQSAHYDVVHDQLDELVERLVACPHRVIPNPSGQPGGMDESSRHRTGSQLEQRGRQGVNWSLLRTSAIRRSSW